jgi:hypothetical protein
LTFFSANEFLERPHHRIQGGAFRRGDFLRMRLAKPISRCFEKFRLKAEGLSYFPQRAVEDE